MHLKKSIVTIAALAVSAIPTLCFAQAAIPLSLNTPGLSTPIEVGLGPSAATLGTTEYVAFQAHDSSDDLYLAHSTDNQNFTAAKIPGITTTNGPAIVAFNGKLYIAYVTAGTIYLISTTNGTSFSSPINLHYYPGGDATVANGQPSAVVNNGKLYIVWESDENYGNTIVNSVASSDGVNFTESGDGIGGSESSDGAQPQTGAEIGITVFKNQLYYAYQAQGDWGHELVICNTTGPVDASCSAYPSITTHSGTTAGVINNALYFAFKDPSSNNYLFMTGSDDGTNFTTPATSYSGARINGNSEISPAINVFNGHMNVFFVSNDGDHNLDLVHN